MPFAAADPLDRQLAHFCAVIRGEAMPLVGARDSLRTLETTLRISDAIAPR